MEWKSMESAKKDGRPLWVDDPERGVCLGSNSAEAEPHQPLVEDRVLELPAEDMWLLYDPDRTWRDPPVRLKPTAWMPLNAAPPPRR